MKTRYTISALCLILSRFILIGGAIGLIVVNFLITMEFLGAWGAIGALLILPLVLVAGPLIAILEGNLIPLLLTVLILAGSMVLHLIGTYLLLMR